MPADEQRADTASPAGRPSTDNHRRAMANDALALVEEQEPEAPATVGVRLRRASVGGDIEVTDVSVEGGSGVVAEDIVADGSLRISGVSARGPQEPPHPPRAREQ